MYIYIYIYIIYTPASEMRGQRLSIAGAHTHISGDIGWIVNIMAVPVLGTSWGQVGFVGL